MEDNSREFRVNKVVLTKFINILVDLYNKGVNFVDLIGINEEQRDVIGISFSREYMHPDYRENYDKLPGMKPTMIKNEKLTDDGINNLID